METLLTLLNKLNMLNPEMRFRLELLVMTRIVRELDMVTSRIEDIRSTSSDGQGIQSIHTRLVNASMQVKVAIGNMKFIAAGKRGDM